MEANEGAQDGNGDGSGDGAGTGTGTGTGVGTRRQTQDGNGDGNGDRSEDCSGDGNGDDDNGNGDGNGDRSEDCSGDGNGTTITGTRIGLGRAEGKRKSARNRKIAVDAARETGETWVESEKNVEKKGFGSVAANPDNLGSNKKAGGGAQGAQDSSKLWTSRESVSPLSRLIRGFRNKYH